MVVAKPPIENPSMTRHPGALILRNVAFTWGISWRTGAVSAGMSPPMRSDQKASV